MGAEFGAEIEAEFGAKFEAEIDENLLNLKLKTSRFFYFRMARTSHTSVKISLCKP